MTGKTILKVALALAAAAFSAPAAFAADARVTISGLTEYDGSEASPVFDPLPDHPFALSFTYAPGAVSPFPQGNGFSFTAPDPSLTVNGVDQGARSNNVAAFYDPTISDKISFGAFFSALNPDHVPVTLGILLSGPKLYTGTPPQAELRAGQFAFTGPSNAFVFIGETSAEIKTPLSDVAVTIAPVPEAGPAPLLLGCAGAWVVGSVLRRRSRAQATHGLTAAF